jgi:DNA ligase-1
MIDLTKFRPMKSASPEQDFDFSKLRYPMWASPKVDGIRCVIHPTMGPVSNTLKPIPNKYIREYLNNPSMHYLDGELVVGDPDNPKSFGATQSGVMSHDGQPNFTFLVFDNFEAGNLCGYGIRKEDAATRVNAVRAAGMHHVGLLEQRLVETYTQLLEYEEEKVSQGYEGIMLRSLDGKYKFNRSTLKEGGMIKIKRFRDDEAIIIGWEPLELNQNAPEKNALGLQRRGYSQSGKVSDDTRVGRFRVRGVAGSRWDGVEFWIGSGLDDADRITFRQIMAKYDIGPEDRLQNFSRQYAKSLPPELPIGKTITFKYQEHGSKDAPRTPIWKGIRYDV